MLSINKFRYKRLTDTTMPKRKDCHILFFCILHDLNVIYLLIFITTCILVFYVILQRGYEFTQIKICSYLCVWNCINTICYSMTGICIIIDDEAKYAQQLRYLIQCTRCVFWNNNHQVHSKAVETLEGWIILSIWEQEHKRASTG